MDILRSSSPEDSLSNNSERLLQRGEVGSQDYIRVFARKIRQTDSVPPLLEGKKVHSPHFRSFEKGAGNPDQRRVCF